MNEAAGRWESVIGEAFEGRRPLETPDVRGAVEGTLAELDAGRLRVAEPMGDAWVTHGWIQQAILLYFRLRTSETIEVGPFEFHDKIPTKRDLARAGVRVVPPGFARYGSFLERGVVLMPSYVNVGARVGEGTGAVIGAGVVLTGSTPIVDVTGSEPRIARGRVPPRAVVIPGTLPKTFPAGEFGTPCALVIGERKASTDLKTSLNQALRTFGVPV
jgi:2,3,4,5-tetrahydropyridine-2-carboxylate N-succinyltransferase